MKRQIEKNLIQWKNKKNRKPLLLLGARQVGKTFILQYFGKNHFNKIHYFDLEEQKNDLLSIFNDYSLNPKEIIDKLSFVSGEPINVQTDFLILDEIQAVPRALTSLKYFNQQMDGLAVAAAGSNLGVATGNESFPIGKVDCIQMTPMNFIEFLTGIEEKMGLNFIEEFKGEKTDDIYHKRLFDILKAYFITGGLPEVILEYKNNMGKPLEAFRAARTFQKQLLFHYQNDFSKYAGSTNSRHINRVFNSISSQLSNTQDKTSKKFIFKDVISKGYRSYEDLADPIDWLIRAGLALKVNTCKHPSVPTSAHSVENNFKLFMFDIGLLGAMTGLTPEKIMQYNYGSYKGYFVENFVLQELYSYGFEQIVNWTGRTSEIEFLVEVDNLIIPVEVKAGINTKAKSLLAYIAKYSPQYSVKFTGSKFGVDKHHNIFNYSLYMISRFPGLSLSK